MKLLTVLLIFLLSYSHHSLAFDMGAHSYAAQAVPVIDADLRQGSLKLYAGQQFSLNIALDAGDDNNKMADWWLVAQAGSQFWSYQSPTGQWADGVWVEGIQAAFQKPLQSFAREQRISLSLPAGVFNVYWGIDTQPDGQVSASVRYSMVQLEVAASGLRTFYVSPQGNDDNNGSITQPWRTPNIAGERALAGDLVLFRAGRYAAQLDIKNSGTAQHPIVFAAMAGESVVFDGESISLKKPNGAPFAGMINAHEVDHVWIMGFDVRNSPDAGIVANAGSGFVVQSNKTYNTDNAGIAVWSSDNFIVDGNDVELANNGGGSKQENMSIAEGSSNFEIRYNYIHDSGDSRGHDGLSLKDGITNGRVHHNVIHDVNNNSCVYIDGWNTFVTDVEIYNNHFYHCPFHGISVAAEQGGSVSNIKIYNNLIYKIGYIVSMNTIGMGIHLGSGYTFAMENIEIFNNTFYDNGPGKAYSGSIVLRNRKGNNISIRNNILASDDFQIQISKRHTPSNVVIEHNLFAHEDKTESNGETLGDNFTIADPLFVDAENADFRLLTGSPAVGIAHPASFPAFDFRLQAR
jgi:hypothetical protein